MLAQRAGIAALSDSDYLHKARCAVQAQKEYVCEKLRELGMVVFEGEAPFVMFFSEKELYEPLREKGILIRRCDEIRGVRDPSEKGGCYYQGRPAAREAGGRGSSEAAGHYYRIGLRSHEDNERLMREIGAIVS